MLHLKTISKSNYYEYYLVHYTNYFQHILEMIIYEKSKAEYVLFGIVDWFAMYFLKIDLMIDSFSLVNVI